LTLLGMSSTPPRRQMTPPPCVCPSSHIRLPTYDHVVRPISHLTGPFQASIASTDPSWPKNDYIYDPLGDFMMECQRYIEYRNWSKDCEDRRGDTVGAAPGCPSPPSTTSPSSPWWISISSSLDYEIVKVTCINLSTVCFTD
jgi:hypothetical protein